MSAYRSLIVFFCAALLVLGSLSASSQQQPAPTIEAEPKTDSAPAQPQAPAPAKNDQADKPASKNAEQEAKEREEARQIRDVNAQESMADAAWWIVRLTIFQIVVGGITIGLLGWTVWETRKTAEAAVKAAEHTANVERAYVFIEPKLIHIGNSRIQFYYGIKNYGKTPATVKSVEVNATILATPPDNTVHTPTETLNDQLVLASDESWPIHRDRPKDCTWKQAQLQDLTERRLYVWFYGSIVYDDVFGIERVTRFRWKVKDWVKQRFHADGGKPYNERT